MPPIASLPGCSMLPGPWLGLRFRARVADARQLDARAGPAGEAIDHIEAAVATAADLPRTKMFDRFFVAAPALLLAWALSRARGDRRGRRGGREASAAVSCTVRSICPILVARGLSGWPAARISTQPSTTCSATARSPRRWATRSGSCCGAARPHEMAAALGRRAGGRAGRGRIRIARRGGARMPRRLASGGRPRGRSRWGDRCDQLERAVATAAHLALAAGAAPMHSSTSARRVAAPGSASRPAPH